MNTAPYRGTVDVGTEALLRLVPALSEADETFEVSAHQLTIRRKVRVLFALVAILASAVLGAFSWLFWSLLSIAPEIGRTGLVSLSGGFGLATLIGLVSAVRALWPRPITLERGAGRAIGFSLAEEPLSRFRTVRIEREFTDSSLGHATVMLVADDESPQIVLRMPYANRESSSRAKAFAVALAAWLEVSLFEHSSPTARRQLYATDKALGLDVSGISPDAATPTGGAGEGVSDTLQNAAAVFEIAVHLLEML
jgi:hypothetical protein